MTARGLLTLVMITALPVVACGPASQSEEPAPAAGFSTEPSVAGRLTLVDAALRFAPCGEEGPGIVVEDLTGEGRTLLDQFAWSGLVSNVMVRLDGNRIQQFRYAGLEGLDCSRLPPDAEVEARGYEPFWSVRVVGATARVHTPEAFEGVSYGGGTWTREEHNRWRYEARTEDGGVPIVLRLTETRCVDNIWAAWYSYQAILEQDGRRLGGCAIEGRRAFR